MNEKAVWTAERVAVLKANGFGKATPAEIAALLGLPEGAVRSKAGKLGVRLTGTLLEPIRARILDLASQGWRPARIARQLSIDVVLVERHMPQATLYTDASPSSRP